MNDITQWVYFPGYWQTKLEADDFNHELLDDPEEVDITEYMAALERKSHGETTIDKYRQSRIAHLSKSQVAIAGGIRSAISLLDECDNDIWTYTTRIQFAQSARDLLKSLVAEYDPEIPF